MLLALVGTDEFAKDRRIAEFWENSLKNGSPRKIFFVSDYPKEENSLTADIAQALTPSIFDEPAASVLLRHCELLLADDMHSLTDFISSSSQVNSGLNLALDFCPPASDKKGEADKKLGIDKRSALWKFLEKQKALEIFEAPKNTNAIQVWVGKHVRECFQKKIDAAAATYIAEAIGSNTKRIHNEIKKIFMYNSSIQEINLQHCMLFIKPNRDVPPYELQEPFGFRDLQAFLPKFQRILAEEPADTSIRIGIVSVLRSHCLNLLHILAMQAKKIPEDEIKSRILPPNMLFAYKVNHLPEQSRRWRLVSLQKTILELDGISYGIKMGVYGNLASFELAICRLLMIA
jgi:DNA polymerase-3 subunit delta